MRILGLDIGARRIGVALSDESATLASPLLVYERTKLKTDLESILEIANSNGCETIVVGYPLELSGKIGFSARKIIDFVKKLELLFSGNIELIDERFSTKEAERVLISSNVRREKRKKVIDKIAATIILQTFLDTNK
jgi:putative pre-16S rRNA nuclease